MSSQHAHPSADPQIELRLTVYSLVIALIKLYTTLFPLFLIGGSLFIWTQSGTMFTIKIWAIGSTVVLGILGYLHTYLEEQIRREESLLLSQHHTTAYPVQQGTHQYET